MSGPRDGIHVSKRVIFILIFVSLFVNVFFLLMGILIGKDTNELKTADPDVVRALLEPPVAETPIDPIESELSVFDSELEDERRDPIDPAYLEEDPIDPAPSRNESTASRAEPTPPRTEPSRARSQPSKPVEKPVDPAPARRDPTPNAKPTPTEVPPTMTPTATVYWIQVSASREAAGASGELKRVQEKGFRGVVIQEGGFYKVRVGPYPSKSGADRAKKRLRNELGLDGWVLRKP